VNRLVRRLVLASLLIALPALGQQMPDPRQMSGKPLPNESVAAGTITVKVVQGDLGSLAAEGTLVHLVAKSADGTSKLLTRPVDDEGRAEFTGLATDGRTVFFALCLLGEDRLESEAITLPPRVGVRVALVGRKLDKAGAPIGPAVDDERRGDAGAPPGPGEVEVSARGRVPAHARVTLREIGGEGAPLSAELDGAEGEGSARFTGVAAGDRVYTAEITVDKRVYSAAPFMMTAAAGAQRLILVHDRLLFAFQGGAQIDDDDLGVELQLIVANMTGVPFDTGPEGVLLPLPRGFTSAQLKDDDPARRAAIEAGAGVRLTGVVPPGQREVVVQFALPIRDGRVTLEMPAPLGMFQSELFIVKSGEMVLVPRAGVSTAPRVERADDGREFYALSNLTLTPGTTLELEIAGLPEPSRWQAWARGLAGVVVVALVSLALVVAARRPRARKPVAPAQQRHELYARRDRLYAELVALERARAAGRIEGGPFETQRKAIMTKLVLVHRELDELDAPTPPQAQP
jgi:hypothetical protein